jgi:chromosome segregation ATPase
MSQDERAKQESQLSSLLGELSAAKGRAKALEKDRGVRAEEVRKEKQRAEDVSAAAEKYAAAQVEVESLRRSQRSTQQHQELLMQQLADLRQVHESLLSELQSRSADASGVSQYLQKISNENLQWKGQFAEVSQQLRMAGREVAGLQASNESCAAQ